MNAKRDENAYPTLLGTLTTTGNTVGLVYVDPSSHRIKMNIGTSDALIASSLSANAPKDENEIASLMGLSTNNTTPVPVLVDPSGYLQVKST